VYLSARGVRRADTEVLRVTKANEREARFAITKNSKNTVTNIENTSKIKTMSAISETKQDKLYSDPVTEYQEVEDANASDRQIGWAGLAGGLCGLALAGPAVGVVAGVTAAALATTQTKAGKFFRSTGDAVATVGERFFKWVRRLTSGKSD
jgi:hypothetical protein